MVWDPSVLASNHTIAHSVATSPIRLWQTHHALSHLGVFTQALPSLAPSFPKTHKAGPSPPPLFSLNSPSSERPFPPQHLQCDALYWGPFTTTLLTTPAGASSVTTASSLSAPCLFLHSKLYQVQLFFHSGLYSFTSASLGECALGRRDRDIVCPVLPWASRTSHSALPSRDNSYICVVWPVVAEMILLVHHQ